MCKATIQLKEALNHIKEAECILDKVLKENYGLYKIHGDGIQEMIDTLNTISDNSQQEDLFEETLKEIISSEGTDWSQSEKNESIDQELYLGDSE